MCRELHVSVGAAGRGAAELIWLYRAAEQNNLDTRCSIYPSV